MAALSYCYDWDMFHHQQLNNQAAITTSTTALFQESEPELLAPELHGFHDDFTLADTCIDPLFEPPEANEFIVSSSDNQYYPHFLPQFVWPHDDDPTKYDSHSICFTPQEFDDNVCSQYNNTKRRKHNYDDHDDQFYLYNNSNNIPSCFLDGYVIPNSTTSTTPAVPSFWPAYGCGGAAEDSKKSNGGSLSAQSVAARRRRKKITEKTEELGTLVPGGRKMNTAEMFQAAFKYVKYLQAQVGMLELMGSIQKNEDPLHQEDLQVLLASPIIQEKLYSEEKCLVPERFVRNLANDHGIHSNPLIMTEINQLLQIDG